MSRFGDRLADVVFGDELIHVGTQRSMILMGLSGVLIGVAIAQDNTIAGIAGVGVSILAIRQHPGAETIAEGWPPEETETDDNGSDRL